MRKSESTIDRDKTKNQIAIKCFVSPIRRNATRSLAGWGRFSPGGGRGAKTPCHGYYCTSRPETRVFATIFFRSSHGRPNDPRQVSLYTIATLSYWSCSVSPSTLATKRIYKEYNNLRPPRPKAAWQGAVPRPATTCHDLPRPTRRLTFRPRES